MVIIHEESVMSRNELCTQTCDILLYVITIHLGSS